MKVRPSNVVFVSVDAYMKISLNSSVVRILPFRLTISMRGQRATGKIQRNNYHHGSCGTSLTSKTSSVSLIFTQGTHRNVRNR